MKKLLFAVLTVVTLALATLGPAQAQGGCGPFGHRGWNGFCHPNGWGPGWHRPWGWHRHWGPGWGWRHRWGWHHHW